MKKIALLILIFASLGFCEFSLEGKVNDIVSRVENCKVFNKKKSLANPLFKELKNAAVRNTKPGFISNSSVVSFKCTEGSARGEFFLLQKGNSILFEFFGVDDLQEGLIRFRLVGIERYEDKDSTIDFDFTYGWYSVIDENEVVVERYETDDDDSFEGLKITVMDSYKILKGAVK